MIVCPKCGHENPDGTMNCAGCRINLEWALGIEPEVIETSGALGWYRGALVAGLPVAFVGFVSAVDASGGFEAVTPGLHAGLAVVVIGMILFLVGLVGSIYLWVSRRRQRG